MSLDHNNPSKFIEVLNPKHSSVSRFYLIWRKILFPSVWLRIFKNRFLSQGEAKNYIDWDVRAKCLGAYSVINTAHSKEELDYVTHKQKEIIFPYFRAALNGSESNILDFGCGVGRFTTDLANTIKGSAVGFDPTKKLIQLCPKIENIKFTDDAKFFETLEVKFDVIWICLVLGGLSNALVEKLAIQIESNLASNGLLFFIEMTSHENNEGSWQGRSINFYRNLFPSVKVLKVGSYHDAGQEISIFSGRKNH